MIKHCKDNIHMSVTSFLYSLYFTANSIPVVFGEVDNMVTLFIIVLFFTLTVYNIRYMKCCHKSFYVIALLSVAFLFSFLVGNSNVVSKAILSFACFGVPVMVAPFSQINFKKVIKFIAFQGLLLVPFFIKYDYGFGGLGGDSYDDGILMTMSYRLLPFIIAGFTVTFDSTNNKYVRFLALVPAVVCAVLLFIVGSRGAQLSVLIFLALFFILKAPTLKSRIRRLIFVALLGVIFIASFSFVIHSLFSFFDDHEISSLAIYRMEGMLDSGHDLDTGRSTIQRQAWKEFFSSPVFGNGIVSFNDFSGMYPHNIVIQLLGEGGIIFGILFFLLAYNVICILFSHGLNSEYAYIVLFITCAGVIKLFFSSTYIESQFFWALVGIIVNRNAIERIKQFQSASTVTNNSSIQTSLN